MSGEERGSSRKRAATGEVRAAPAVGEYEVVVVVVGADGGAEDQGGRGDGDRVAVAVAGARLVGDA